MKILIFSDCHWSTNSSIVRSRGEEFSTRLELLIESMNWLNNVAEEHDCDVMICAGDMMDKPQLTDEELTALNRIKWNSKDCYYVCGNHESSVHNLRYSSVKSLEGLHGKAKHVVVDSYMTLDAGTAQVHLLPYVVESDRKQLADYLVDKDASKKQIVISHNDIAGIHYGAFTSVIGFSIDEINSNCDLYLNGHLHNSEFVDKRILNVGSFSGHNFTNDSSKYEYGVWILDTDTLLLKFIENPFSLNFYKFDITSQNDIHEVDSIKNNAVVSVKCFDDMLDDCQAALTQNKQKILEQRITVIKRQVESDDSADICELQGTSYMSRLITFCHDKINNTEILDQELAEICKIVGSKE